MTSTNNPQAQPQQSRRMSTMALSGLFTTSQVSCADLGKSTSLVQTGIGYLDHMIDQIQSHAQVGVGLTVHHHVDLSSLTQSSGDNNKHGQNGGGGGNVEVAYEDHNRLAECNQASLVKHVGWTLGSQLALLNKFLGLEDHAMVSSRFCCPLDEALVECRLVKPAGSHKKRKVGTGGTDGSTNGSTAGIMSTTTTTTVAAAACKEGRLVQYTLAPFGKYPKNKGRTYIGKLQTSALEEFWKSLAQSTGLEITLLKIRGDNGHHIVESSFKAFSRALRNLLDGTDTTTVQSEGGGGEYQQAMWGTTSNNWKASLALQRRGSIERSTKETNIQVQLALDGGAAGISVKTGIATLDEFFTVLAQEACMSLRIDCTGDLWVDDHHTAEDVAIAVGQVLTQALGTKAGLNRMWCAQGTQGKAVVEVTMDLSNRPCLTHNLGLEETGDEMVGDLSVEMLDHVLDSLVVNGRMTVHILLMESGNTSTSGSVSSDCGSLQDRAMATATAFGRALKLCAMVDSRRAGQTASSKGTLAV